MATSGMAIITVPDVEICQTGIEYPLMSGPWTPTEEDLLHAVQSQDDPAIQSPRVGLGHIDPRFNNPEFDGQPAFGKVTSLRLANQNQTLVGDFVVPEWIGELMPIAWPSRSLEAARGVETVTGHKWNVVLTSVKLLGIMLPGITTIDDIPLMYGTTTPEGVELSEEIKAVQEQIAASKGGDMRLGRKGKVDAAVNVEDVRRVYYSEELTDDQYWWWIRAIEADKGQLIVDNDDGQLFRVSYNVKGDEVTFAEPVEVKVRYEDVKAGAGALVAGMVAENDEAIVYGSRAESRPETQGGGEVDGVQLRSSLGLAATASDAEVTARIQELTANADPGGGDGGDGGDGDGDGDGDEGKEGATTPPAEPATPPAQPEPGTEATVTLDAGTFARVKKLLDDNATNEKKDTISSALTAGKFPPARKSYWEAYWDRDPDGAKQALASLEPGLVPVNERGSANPNDISNGDGTDTGEGLPDQWFPEVTARRAAAAKGTPQVVNAKEA